MNPYILCAYINECFPIMATLLAWLFGKIKSIGETTFECSACNLYFNRFWILGCKLLIGDFKPKWNTIVFIQSSMEKWKGFIGQNWLFHGYPNFWKRFYIFLRCHIYWNILTKIETIARLSNQNSAHFACIRQFEKLENKLEAEW